MGNYRERLEAGFEAWGGTLFRHRVKTIFLMAIVVGALVSGLPPEFDTSTEGFFHEDDPAKISYDEFRDQFGREDAVLVLIRPTEVFNRDFLTRLGEFHQALKEEVPYLEDVTSLVNVRNTRGEGDRLIVEDLLKILPANAADMATLKVRVLSSTLYPNFFISENGEYTAILLETLAYSPGATEGTEGTEDSGEVDTDAFEEDPEKPGEDAAGENQTILSNEENAAIVKAVREVTARFEGEDFQVYIAGSPVWGDFLIHAMPRDMGRFMLLAMLAIGTFLFVLFRRVSGVVLPLLVVLLSLASTIGLMAWSGTKFSTPTAILPSFLLAVGVGASVHLLSIFFREFTASGSKEGALAYALGHSGLPILMTGLTTSAGLFAFVTADLASIGDLGFFGGIGVLISLLYTLILLPALLALWPLKQSTRLARPGNGKGLDSALEAIADFAIRRAWSIVILSAMIVAFAGVGLTWMKFSHSPIRWIPRTTQLRQALDLVDREMKGSSTVEVVIDTGKENGLYEPDVMNRIDALVEFAGLLKNRDGRPYLGKANSVSDVLKETHKALNGNDKAFYAVPRQRELIAQELLLFENSGSDDLKRMVDSQFSQARLSLKVHNEDASEYVRFVGEVRREATRLFGSDASVTLTGIMTLFTGIVDNMMSSMVKSYSIAAAVIAVMMIVLLSSFRIGMLSMVPNLAPILVTLGLMGWSDIPLDGFTLLIGSISLGLAVDDTIHFFHNFRRYYGQTRNTRDAVRMTLATTGRAMLITTLVLVTGFWLFMFASLNNVFYFGLLTGTTLIIALLGDFLLAPAMLELITRTERGARICGRWCKAEGNE